MHTFVQYRYRTVLQKCTQDFLIIIRTYGIGTGTSTRYGTGGDVWCQKITLEYGTVRNNEEMKVRTASTIVRIRTYVGHKILFLSQKFLFESLPGIVPLVSFSTVQRR